MRQSVKQYLHSRADFDDKDDVFSPPKDLVRIILCGHYFDLTEEACCRIPRLRVHLRKRVFRLPSTSSAPSTRTSGAGPREETPNSGVQQDTTLEDDVNALNLNSKTHSDSKKKVRISLASDASMLLPVWKRNTPPAENASHSILGNSDNHGGSETREDERKPDGQNTEPKTSTDDMNMSGKCCYCKTKTVRWKCLPPNKTGPAKATRADQADNRWMDHSLNDSKKPKCRLLTCMSSLNSVAPSAGPSVSSSARMSRKRKLSPPCKIRRTGSISRDNTKYPLPRSSSSTNRLSCLSFTSRLFRPSVRGNPFKKRRHAIVHGCLDRETDTQVFPSVDETSECDSAAASDEDLAPQFPRKKVQEMSFHDRNFCFQKRLESCPCIGPYLAQIQPRVTMYFARDVRAFEAIVNFAQTNELHLPGQLCPKLFAQEMAFWGVDLDLLQPCCFPSVVRFLDEQEKVTAFHRAGRSAVVLTDSFQPCLGFWRQLRIRMWPVLDEPSSGRLAKVYFCIVCLMIFASVFAIVAGTHKYFQHEVPVLTSSPSIKHFNNGTVQNGTATTSNNQSVEVDTVYQEVVWLSTVRCISTYFFCVDYLLRCLFLPDRRLIFLDPINVADGLALLAALVQYLLGMLLPEEDLTSGVRDRFNVLLMLRMLRFIRPMSKMRGFRVLYFTLKCSLSELLLVLSVTLLLVTVFATLLYYLGDKKSVKSIPHGMWYALVTMTTVGYGDIVPMGFAGKLIGSACVLCGVVLISMTTPIVVSNFLTLYANSKIKPVVT